MELIVWQSIVIGLMLTLGFTVSAYRLVKVPRPDYLVAVKVHEKSIFLLVFRILTISLFLIVYIIRMYKSNWHDLVYYTYWNFTLQTIYISCAIVDQIQRWYNRPTTANKPLNALFDSAFTSCFLVCFVYWIVLIDPSDPIEWTTVVVHGVNLILLFIEFALNDHLIQKNNMKFVIMWPALYGAVTWIMMATGLNDTWPYELLDISKPLAPLKWFGIAVGHAFAFGLVLLLSLLKFKVVGVNPPTDPSLNGGKVDIKVVPNNLV